MKLLNQFFAGVTLISPMPAGLVNRLNEQEITDLIAYLLAGGNKDNFKK